MTDQQMAAFNQMSRALRTRVDRLRSEDGITKPLIELRDGVFGQLDKTDLKGEALWNTLQEKAELTDAQRVAFRRTHEANKQFRVDALKLLTDDQRARLLKRGGK